MVKRNGFAGRVISATDRFDRVLSQIGDDLNTFFREISMDLEQGFRNIMVGIPSELRQYREYRRRICHLCGEKIPKGEGMESYSSFILYHNECFEKVREMQDYHR